VDGKALQDGDEIIVGRYRLMFLRVPADGDPQPHEGGDHSSMQSAG
jgi:hypothetical protein